MLVQPAQFGLIANGDFFFIAGTDGKSRVGGGHDTIIQWFRTGKHHKRTIADHLIGSITEAQLKPNMTQREIAEFLAVRTRIIHGMINQTLQEIKAR